MTDVERITFVNMRNHIPSLLSDIASECVNASDIIERYNNIIDDAHYLGLAMDLKPLTVGSFEEIGEETAVVDILARLQAEIMLSVDEYNKRAVVEAIEKLFNRLIAEDISDDEIKVAYTSISDAMIEYKIGTMPPLDDEYVADVGFRRAVVYALYSALEWLKEGKDIDELEMYIPDSNLPAPTFHAPKNVPSLTSQVTRDIFDNSVVSDVVNAWDVNDSSRSEKKKGIELKTHVAIVCDSTDFYEKYRLTPFEKSVLEAVISLRLAGNTYFTIDMAWRALVGRADAQPTEKQYAKICDAIKKLRRTRCEIDMPTEMYKRRGVSIDEHRHEDVLLNVERDTITAGGKTVIAFKFLNDSILYLHSKMLGQIQTVDIGLLDIKKMKDGKATPYSREVSERFIVIRDILISRINGMLNENNNLRQDVIDFDGIYEKCMYDMKEDSSRSLIDITKKRIREEACDILNYYKCIGVIDGYELVKKGRTIHAIRIIDSRITKKLSSKNG